MNRSILGAAALLLFPLKGFSLEYEKDIMPFLVQKCGECHSADAERVKGGLRLDDPEHFQKRFDKNSLVVPGDWDASYLFITIYRPPDDEDAMPPKGKGERLTEDEVKLVQQWITEGAPINGTRGARGTMPAETPAAPANPVIGQELELANREGKTLRATVLAVEESVVVLRMKNGVVYRYEIANLSEESQAKLKAAVVK